MAEEYKEAESVDLSGMTVSGEDIQSEISSSYDELLSEDSDLYKSPVAVKASSNLVKQELMNKFKISPKRAMDEIKEFLSKQDIKESYLDNLILDTAEEVDLSKSHYKAQYKEVFKEYPLGLFRKHLRDKHSDLAREKVPDKKNEKIQKIVAESNAIIRAFGYLIGFRRMKAKSTKSTEYAKAWEEREDLRELLFGRIMMPMMESIKPSLKREVSEKQDLLKQDIQAVEQPVMEQVAQPAPNNFRIGAVIDVEKLGINTELLRQVLTGQTRSMPEQQSLPQGKADRRLIQPGEGGADISSVESGVSEREQALADLPSETSSVATSDIQAQIDALFGSDEESQAMSQFREQASTTARQSLEVIKNDNTMSPSEKINELANLIQQFQNRLNAQAMTTGQDSPATVQLRKDVQAIRNYRGILVRARKEIYERAAPSQAGGGQAVVVTPDDDSQDSDVPTEDAKNIKKKDKKTFEPSRRRVIEQAQQLVLKSIRPQRGSRLMNPVSEPDNVNYYAPNYRHRYRGGLRVIQ